MKRDNPATLCRAGAAADGKGALPLSICVILVRMALREGSPASKDLRRQAGGLRPGAVSSNKGRGPAMKTLLNAVFVAVGLVCALAGGEANAQSGATFTTPPSARKAGDKTVISFAVNAGTDVAVYVLDAKGKAVRHLVAGVIGGKGTPPPPLKPGLSQSIEWDGKNDRGEPASGGPFKVRVVAGMKPSLEGFLLYNPDAIPRLQTLAAAPGGEVYVFHSDSVSNGNQGGLKIRVIDREGHYKRMLLPYPADLPYEKVQPLGAFKDEEGRLVPLLQNYQTLSLWPDVTGVRGRTLSTACPAVDSKGTVHWLIRGGRMLSLDSRGGCPYGEFIGPELFPGDKTMTINDRYKTESATMAVGEGDKYVYISGLHRTAKGKKGGGSIPCVYRVDLAARAKPEVFAGKPDQPGTKGESLTAPVGVACAEGLVYVADAKAGRIVAFKEADGSVVGEIKAEAPHYIGVDAASGAVYAVCGPNVNKPNLVKFDGIRSGKEVCRVTLPASTHTKVINHRIAVDSSAKPVRIWATIMAFRNVRFCQVDDAGGKLTVNDAFRPRTSKWSGIPQDLMVDRERGELYVRGVTRFDDATGKIKDEVFQGKAKRDLGWGGYTAVPMADGSLVTFGNGKQGGLKRWAHDGKPLSWEGASTNGPQPTGILKSIMTLGPVGGITALGNEFYIVSPKDNKGQTTLLNVHGLDGRKKRTVVWGVNVRSTPRLDARGNVYLATPVKPKGKYAPAFFDGKLPKVRSYQNSYNYLYGSIVKFPPSGGAMYYTGAKGGAYGPEDVPAEIKKKPRTAFSYPCKAFGAVTDGEAQGAEWIRFGFAPFSSKWGGGTAFCHCENSAFDADPFGRVFYPNLGQFRVEMVDTNNNVIGTFGHYGNQDSGGPDATVKKPEIPLAWPAYVAVSDNYAYVSDSINLRIARVKLGYGADRTCSVQ